MATELLPLEKQDPLSAANIAKYQAANPQATQPGATPAIAPPIVPEVPASLDASKLGSDSQELSILLAKNEQLKRDEEFKKSLTPDTPAPEAPNMEGKYTGLRTSYGVDALNSSLSAKNQEILKLQDSWKLEKSQMESGRGTVGDISGGVAKTGAERQAQLDTLLREKALMMDELNTKNSIIGNIMQFAQSDYATAKDNYDKTFDRNLQIQTSLENYKTKEEATANAARDDARANLTTLMGTIKESNKDWSTLDSQTKLNLQTLELKAGIPQGTISQFIVYHPKSDVISTSVREFNGQKFTDIVARDPDTGKIFVDSYGMGNVDVAKKSGGGGTQTESADIEQNAQAVFEGRLNLTGVPIRIRSAVDKRVQELKQSSNKYDSEFEARVDYDQEMNQLQQAKNNNELGGTPSEIITALVNSYGKRISPQEIQATVYSLFGIKPEVKKQPTNNIIGSDPFGLNRKTNILGLK